jgi:hypothetical protein
MHPVETAKVESDFSRVGWIKSARRNRLGQSALRALSILVCNKDRAAGALAEIARRFLSGNVERAAAGGLRAQDDDFGDGVVEEGASSDDEYEG